MREVRSWVSGMMVSRLGLVSGVCKGGLVFRLCPSSRHVQTYPHTTLYKELVRGVASHPIHVSCGSAPAQINIVWMCIILIIPIVDEIWFCPYTALSKMFSYTVNRTVKKSLTCISHVRTFFINHVYWTHPLNTDMLVLYIRYNVCGVHYILCALRTLVYNLIVH